MRKKDVVKMILPKEELPSTEIATAFAPVNFALAKYWGKRDEELLLPITDSFSVAIDAGTTTTISQANERDIVVLNGEGVEKDHPFYENFSFRSQQQTPFQQLQDLPPQHRDLQLLFWH
jgi:mevalonate pyrophosphate decarboxylase